jgi:pSer/pThr/pTyr-binding forkhead associated (FHA) protein
MVNFSRLANGFGGGILAEVVVELNGKEVARVPLKGPSMTVGRDSSADVHLDNRALSRRHAQLEKRGAGIWIRDLGSQNGTFVNGERISAPQPLSNQDLVEVGRYQIRVDGLEEARGDTPVLTIAGPEGRHRFAMVGEEVIIGRSPSCDISIGHKSISRKHLKICIRGADFTAEDMGSQNGTRLHGKRIRGATPFEPGDQLQMSDYTVEVGFLEEAIGADSGKNGESANKTMMIDRSELAKAADLGGDFELASSAGKLAYGKSREAAGTGRDHGATGGHDDLDLMDEEASQTKGRPADEEKKGKSKKRVSTKKRPPTQSRVPSGEPIIVISHPDGGEHEIALTRSVTVVAEDGTEGDSTEGRPYADQGYMVFTRTAEGVVTCVVGDRRLITVNGKARLTVRLTDGDTVEFGLLTAMFKEP